MMKERVLKLTNIVYKASEFFPESDPLKNRTKDRALLVLENPNIEDIDILLGYLWIAKCQGWMSQINYLILVNEYESIKKETKVLVEPVLLKDTEIKSPRHFFSGRKEKIVSFLEKNEKGQVMDLQKVMPDVTKRTIRRDLDELLSAGKIARFGEFNQVFYKIKEQA